MSLQFERGDRTTPAGHALIYFRGDSGVTLASYVVVQPIRFDITKFMPPMLTGMMQGMDLGDAMAVVPMPPFPEEVSSVEYLYALADRRRDDVLYGGVLGGSNPMQWGAALGEVAREYGEAYEESVSDMPSPSPVTVPEIVETSPYADMNQAEQLKELTMLTGRLHDSLATGGDPDIDRQMRHIANLLPPKYRADDLLMAAHIPGERGRQLSQLYLERCYKLFNEDYLDLERIDREIEALRA